MSTQRNSIVIFGSLGRQRVLATGAFVFLLVAPSLALAQVSDTLNGPPAQVTPYVPETGLPQIAIPQGTLNTSPSGSGNGSGGTSAASGSDPLVTMLAQSWGSSAIANAQALGVNPSALAATCVIESGCGADLGSAGAASQGVFQMQSAAFQEGLQTALAANPSLASQIVQGAAGMDDPTTEAIAASGYLMQANSTLEEAGVSNPTVLDARGYYNFGPTYAVPLAQAPTSEPIANVLSGMSQSALAENGISAGETVGQWQASVASEIGNTTNQSILS